MNIKQKDGVLIAKPEGRIDGVNALNFHGALTKASGKNSSVVLVNMAAVNYIDSAVLRTFLLVAKTLQQRSAQFALCSLSAPIQEVFEVSGFDRIIAIYASEEEALATLAPQVLNKEKMIFFRTLFLMFGKLAKTDSHVSQEEINSIEAIMTNAEFDQETREEAIEFFNEGKTTKTPFREIAAECAQHAEDVEMRRDALYCLVRIAAADGALHVREKRYLNEAVAAFGLPPNVLAEALEEMLPDMQQYYAILGCDPSASDDELKRCYREVSRQYHPDVISSKNLAPGFEKFAKEKFQEIQNAYDIIIEHRKL